MIYIVKKYKYYIKSILDTSVLILSILQQVLALKNTISQLDNKNAILSVSLKVLKVGRIVHALLKRFSL